MRTRLSGWDKAILRRWMVAFIVALLVPTALLIYQAFDQLKWAAFHQSRTQAEELTGRIDAAVVKLIARENARAFTDYEFLAVSGDKAANFVQRSPLSQLPGADSIPGLIGYFQIDDLGALSSPLLPEAAAPVAAYGISTDELRQRQALVARMTEILATNRLARGGRAPLLDMAASIAGSAAIQVARDATPALQAKRDAEPGLADRLIERGAVAPEQQRFDQLNSGLNEKKRAATLGRIEDLKLDNRFNARFEADAPAKDAVEERRQQTKTLAKDSARKEQNALPATSPLPARSKQYDVRIHTFESELDGFQFAQIDSGHAVLFRKVWREGRRYVQGAVFERAALLRGLLAEVFEASSLAQTTALIVGYRDEVLATYRGLAKPGYDPETRDFTGTVLYQSHLSAPFNELNLLFSITRLPVGTGAVVVAWAAGILLLVIATGGVVIYRFGAKQIDLTRQQQDFVSAVSHELRTPLTSIRLYGEMLREGWAPEEKKKTYYEFIHGESERLSRLISNVLQLARLTRNETPPTLKAMTLGELSDLMRSKLTTQLDRAGFALNFADTPELNTAILVDPDNFIQIVINLVDNALKFARDAEYKVIDIAWSHSDTTSVLSVRDHGPGVARDQLKKIFKLFYRGANELTRETVGTGIGLALVQELMRAMGGGVEAQNRTPGTEFRLAFPVCISE
ncbi:MAG: HAMP domain-containing histidine kinase [Gammaproteobacteria bacterium]|nr:HAMP domain-containing histidine kinase [Gammaproteobacteria bacterium]